MQGFWYLALSPSSKIGINLWNPVKFTRTRKTLQNLVEILSNTCLYSNFETCLSYWGYLLAVNSQIYVKTLWLKRANNVPKLPGVDYVVENWFISEAYCCWKSKWWPLLEKRLKCRSDQRKTDWFLAKFALKITAKSAVFLPIAFRPSLPPKISAKSADFSAILSPNNPMKFDFFSAIHQKP